MNEWNFNRIRIQFLSENIIRIERLDKGKFEDRNTFFIPSREAFCGFDGYALTEREKTYSLVYKDIELEVPKAGRSLNGIRLRINGKTVYRYKKQENRGELPPIGKTGEVFAVTDSPRVIVPDGGYTYRESTENNGFEIDEDAEDVYLLLCGKDAKLLRRLYVALTGRAEMVRLSHMGLWNSRYYAWTQKGAEDMIAEYARQDIPLDNFVLDVDWRTEPMKGLTYEVNVGLFPDLKGFFDFAHAHGVEVVMNDHPVPYEAGRHVFEEEEVGRRESDLIEFLKAGLDGWWYDRNWHTRIISPTKRINYETLGAYFYHDITKHYFQSKAKDNKVHRRAVALSNADNVIHGAYEEIKNTASHRFPLQWTGDIPSDSRSLQTEIESTLRGGDNCIPYLHPDCGGHHGNPDAELYLRWIAFSALSPVIRPHASNTAGRYREPWQYDEKTLSVARDFIKLHYRLLPVFYREAHNAYMTGEPVLRRLSWEYPHDKRAQRARGEYLIGRDILVVPAVGKRMYTVEKSRYVTPVYAEYFAGHDCAGKVLARVKYRNIDFNWTNEPPCKNVPAYDFSACFRTRVRFDREAELIVWVDDGATLWVDGKKVMEDRAMKSGRHVDAGRLTVGEHDIKIEYFQAGASACLALRYTLVQDDGGTEEVYFPAGEWLDVFGGKLYKGGRTCRVPCTKDTMPLFVRLGAVVPLARDCKNTKEQKWNRLTLDYYPSESAPCEGGIYEDDGETTGYMYGEYRTQKYLARYEPERGVYRMEIFPAVGTFAGDRFCTAREYTVRFHLLGRNICGASVGGVPVRTETIKRDKSSFPLGVGGRAADSDVLLLKFGAGTEEHTVIEFTEEKGKGGK